MEGCRAALPLSELRQSQSGALFGPVFQLCKPFLLVSKSSTNSLAQDPSACIYLQNQGPHFMTVGRLQFTTQPTLSSLLYKKLSLGSIQVVFLQKKVQLSQSLAARSRPRSTASLPSTRIASYVIFVGTRETVSYSCRRFPREDWMYNVQVCISFPRFI